MLKYLPNARKPTVIVISILGIVCLAIFLTVFTVAGRYVIDPLLGENASAWFQTGLAIVAVPLLMFQLYELAQSLNKKPIISIGLVNVRSLPFSNVRDMKLLPETIDVSTGYAHFYLIIRNSGDAPARHIKIYLEHRRLDGRVNTWIYSPLVKVSEASDKKQQFWSENNFDFVFRASPDWIIHADDIEPFGFHLTTTVSDGQKYNDSKGEEHPRMMPPEPRSYVELTCTVWIDSLEKPICKLLRINVVENYTD